MSSFLRGVRRITRSSGSSNPTASDDHSPLTVLTWNIWFDRFAYDVRMEMISRTIQEKSPDVVCLQEVLPRFIPMLLKQSWMELYDLSDDGTGSSVEPYGVAMLVKKHLMAEFHIHEMPTRMDRDLLTAQILKFGKPILVASAHLESLDNHRLREKQLQKCKELFHSYPNVVFCGDFNFCSYRNYIGSGDLENDSLGNILPDFVDVWPNKYPDEKGYTFDSAVNKVIHRYEQMRYDRVLFKSSDSFLRILDIEVEGTQSAIAMGIAPTRVEEELAVVETEAEPIRLADPFSTPPKPKAPKLAIKTGQNADRGFSVAELEEVCSSDHFALLASFASSSS